MTLKGVTCRCHDDVTCEKKCELGTHFNSLHRFDFDFNMFQQYGYTLDSCQMIVAAAYLNMVLMHSLSYISIFKRTAL